MKKTSGRGERKTLKRKAGDRMIKHGRRRKLIFLKHIAKAVREKESAFTQRDGGLKDRLALCQHLAPLRETMSVNGLGSRFRNTGAGELQQWTFQPRTLI